jgi:hypothetical protein
MCGAIAADDWLHRNQSEVTLGAMFAASLSSTVARVCVPCGESGRTLFT